MSSEGDCKRETPHAKDHPCLGAGIVTLSGKTKGQGPLGDRTPAQNAEPRMLPAGCARDPLPGAA